VAVVDVDGYHRVPLEFVHGRRGGRWDRPGGVDVPAPARQVVADVVADRAGGGLGGDLITPVRELDTAG
jgi:hypothetical protein